MHRVGWFGLDDVVECDDVTSGCADRSDNLALDAEQGWMQVEADHPDAPDAIAYVSRHMAAERQGRSRLRGLPIGTDGEVSGLRPTVGRSYGRS
jgi:hypothetical protein